MFHYLDNAATTPVRPEAAQAALEAMTGGWGNPSSQYALGKQAAERMKSWRADLAGALGCEAGEVFFTSCGSESDNWAVLGALHLNRRAGKHILTTAIEHAAVLETCKELERQGSLIFSPAAGGRSTPPRRPPPSVRTRLWCP